MKDLRNLFDLAYSFIEFHNLKLYVIKFEPDVVFGRKIKLQGEIEPNEPILSQLNMVYYEENDWYVYKDNEIELTLTL